jgi:preprotein translocase subunit SecA
MSIFIPLIFQITGQTMIGTVTKLLKQILGDKNVKDIKAMTPLVNKTNEIFATLSGISDDELRNKTLALKQIIKEATKEEEAAIESLEKKVEDNPEMPFEEKEIIYKDIDEKKEHLNTIIEKVLKDILPEAFAIVKETSRRLKENKQLKVKANDFDRYIAGKKSNVIIEGEHATWLNEWDAAGNRVVWDMVHYDVQLIGGIALHEGKIAEMQTGEGKTLVATLPVFLNALAGKGVHLVTVNDYLARRDSEWMAPLFEFHGMKVDCIDYHQPNSEERRNAYLADVTYGTNNEFGFDYLRDNMAINPENLVQRKHHYAIVDEVDSVLIDDARTPLIISGPTPKGDKQEFMPLKPKIEKLVTAQRQLVQTLMADSKKLLMADGQLTSDKKALKDGGLALLRCHRGLPKNKALIKFLSESGVKAHLLKTEAYFLQDQAKEMPFVDEELFFIIDEKNNSIELTDKGIDLLSSGAEEDKDFFIMTDIGSVMAEIDNSSISDEEKLKQKDTAMNEFSVKAERIHTINQLLKAYTLFEKDVEYVVMDNKVKIVDEQTGRIMEGRRYSDGLHQAIEAKENVKIEAATQTYATVTLQNYFRMYHKLSGMTGTAETEAKEFWDIYELDVVIIPTNRPVVRDDREDLIYKTKREKYNAIIEEVVSLTEKNRPVLVGTTSVEVSELLGKMLTLRKIKHNVLNAKLHQREAEIVAEAGNPGIVTIATNMAGRGTDIKLKPGVKDAGGLAIIGTERHDSRRVDRQLRGRAGRQGDPGSSQFFVSLEDDLMRLFGSDRIARLMDRLGHQDGEAIQAGMITKSIERAQKKVEENNFGIRKRLLEYDDVMNAQREVIYKKRRHALYGDRLSLDIELMFDDVCNAIVEENYPYKDYEGLRMAALKELAIEVPFDEAKFNATSPEQLSLMLFERVRDAYKNKNELLAQQAFPVIANVYENESAQYENIVVPLSDGVKSLRVVANLKKTYESKGKYVITELEKGVTLAMIDDAWKEHLREMDDLRQSVQGAVYEQKDPLLIYKFESFELFKKMITRVNKEIISFLVKAKLPERQEQVKQASRQDLEGDLANVQTSRAQGSGEGQQSREKPKAQPVRVEKTVGRNDLCPCGSGQKFKNCHGK